MVRAKIWNRKPGLEASAHISCLLVDLTRVYRLVTDRIHSKMEGKHCISAKTNSDPLS